MARASGNKGAVKNTLMLKHLKDDIELHSSGRHNWFILLYRNKRIVVEYLKITFFFCLSLAVKQELCCKIFFAQWFHNHLPLDWFWFTHCCITIVCTEIISVNTSRSIVLQSFSKYSLHHYPDRKCGNGTGFKNASELHIAFIGFFWYFFFFFKISFTSWDHILLLDWTMADGPS